jgi:chaperonin GroES
MKIRPLQDRVVLKRDQSEETTAGGIIIPQAAQEKMSRGTVQAVARGRIMEDGTVAPLCVDVGDRVLFGKYAGADIEIDGEELVILREEDIIGTLEA